MSRERAKLLRAYGAEVHETPSLGGMAEAIGSPRRSSPSAARSCRSSSRTPPTPRSTAARPRRRSGATSTARSTRSSPGSAPAARSPASARCSRSAGRASTSSRSSPASLGGALGRPAGAAQDPGHRGRASSRRSSTASVIDEVIRVERRDRARGRARGRASARACWSGSRPEPRSPRRSSSRARPEMAGKRIVTIACDGGERYMSLPLLRRRLMLGLGTLGRVLREIGSDVASARDRDPAARGVGSVEILSSWAGVQALLAHRVSHALYEARVPARAAGDLVREPRRHRGRDPPGGEDRARVLHRPRLRRGDRRDGRDRRPGHALPGGHARRHRVRSRQAPPDARRRRHDRARGRSCSAR